MDSTLDLAALRPSGIRRFTRVEYDDLVDRGIFSGERVELLRGIVVTMSPEGERHASTVEWLTQRLFLALQERFAVRVSAPFGTPDSEPQPDLYVGPRVFHDDRPRVRAKHPETALLLIEVANSSLQKDRRIKNGIYAAAGVPEYWIVNVTEDDELEVEVYTDPTPDGYATMHTLRDGDVLRPRLLPLAISVADIPY